MQQKREKYDDAMLVRTVTGKIKRTRQTPHDIGRLNQSDWRVNLRNAKDRGPKNNF